MEEIIYFVLSKGGAIIIEENIAADIKSRKAYFAAKKEKKNQTVTVT